MLFFPVLDDFFIPLVGFAHRLLQREPQLLEQTAYVCRMVAYAELSTDHLGYSRTGPYISPKAMRRCSPGQQFGQFRTLLFTQTGRRTRRSSTPETSYALLASPLHPLAYGSFSDSQSLGYLLLSPTLPLEFPRT